MVIDYQLCSNQPKQRRCSQPKNTLAFTRVSNTLAISCKYLSKTLLIRNSKKEKRKDKFFNSKVVTKLTQHNQCQKHTKNLLSLLDKAFSHATISHMLYFSPVDERAKEWQKRVLSH